MNLATTFTLKTREGSKRLLVLFIVLILLGSLFARWIQTDFGRIKIEQISIDARGAELTGELYYPAGTTSKDLYPGIVITHGGGCTYMTSRIWAQELARRDFVVLNVNVYGAGTSAQPVYDENDKGIEAFERDLTPMGLIDAKNFLSSLTFVDSERIGMAGHSMGSRRTGYAAVMDCGYFTLNDRLVNILYDTFNVQLTEAEIYTDADTLAEKYLNTDQLSHYQDLAEATANDYNQELQAICIIGGDAPVVNQMQAVTVAGYEVMRNCQVNLGLLNGDFDVNYYDFEKRDSTKLSWHTGSENIQLETWYAIDDETDSSSILGEIYETSVVDNAELDAAFTDRSARIIMRNNENHSRNFFSVETTSDLIKYFEQALKYNRGDLSSSSAQAIPATNNTWMWRTAGNTVAMLSMFGMLLALASLIFKSKDFECCVCSTVEGSVPPLNKKMFWGLSAVTVVFSFVVMYMANKYGVTLFTPSQLLPLGLTAAHTVYFLIGLAIMSAVLLAVYVFVNKKQHGITGLVPLNIKMNVRSILKCILASLLLLCAAYGSLMVIDYFFGQDYRAWMTAFTEMKADFWFAGIPYAVIIFPLFVIIGAAVNYTVRTDLPEWLDTLILIVVNSLGIWLCCLANYAIAKVSYDGTLFSVFNISYQFLLSVPITLYLSRKLFRLTKNIWTGAALNTIIIVWSMMGSLGINDAYIGQTLLSNFLNV